MSNEINSYTLTPSEVEKLLASQFGAKLAPVDDVKLSKGKLARDKRNQFANKNKA
ncbi:MAG: hypothetical protein LLG02_14815 [Pelosinus sp.]|nr:hypothetical protein [Pelosinus sp.]